MSVKPTLLELILNATAAGKSMLSAANAAAQKTLLSLVKSDVGLGNVDNISDANKPVSVAQQTALDAKQPTLVSGTNIKTVNGTTLLGSGDITAGLSGTGSVDNAALRANGTGDASLQSSSWIIHDNLTASPNNTVNHACVEATGSTTNVSVSVKPKGTGSFSLHAPDGTTTGGNVRGANAVDLQTYRSAATHVASGAGSFSAGYDNTASGQYSVAMGNFCFATTTWSVAMGYFAQATSTYAVAIGRECVASGDQSVAIGGYGAAASGSRAIVIGGFNSAASAESSVTIGYGSASSAAHAHAYGLSASATRYGMSCRASGSFAAAGDAQRVEFTARNKTTNATPTTLYLDGSSTRFTIPSGKVLSFSARITGIKSDGSAVAEFVRKGVIKNVGGTTALVGSVETIGTDIEDNASTDVAITADNTNDALQINVTGITGETWRWVAVVEGLEIAYGT